MATYATVEITNSTFGTKFRFCLIGKDLETIKKGLEAEKTALVKNQIIVLIGDKVHLESLTEVTPDEAKEYSCLYFNVVTKGVNSGRINFFPIGQKPIGSTRV